MMQIRKACKVMQIQKACKYSFRGSKNEQTHDSDMHQASDMHKGT